MTSDGMFLEGMAKFEHVNLLLVQGKWPYGSKEFFLVTFQ